MAGHDPGDAGDLRLDLWLWHTRFFKTRGLAADAVKAGQVAVNDARAKPARGVRPGDWVEIHKDQQRFRVRVLSLPVRRGPAIEAVTCYAEDLDVRAQREADADRRRQERQAIPMTAGRPDRRTWRKLRDLKSSGD